VARLVGRPELVLTDRAATGPGPAADGDLAVVELRVGHVDAVVPHALRVLEGRVLEPGLVRGPVAPAPSAVVVGAPVGGGASEGRDAGVGSVLTAARRHADRQGQQRGEHGRSRRHHGPDPEPRALRDR
jgi:hypothetical protein